MRTVIVRVNRFNGEMSPVRLAVVPRGQGYVAQSNELKISAVAATAVDAAESGRLMALAMLGKDACDAMLLLRVDEPDVSRIVMQPLSRTVSLDAETNDRDWHYVATMARKGTAQ
jgi:hypothetical protein